MEASKDGTQAPASSRGERQGWDRIYLFLAAVALLLIAIMTYLSASAERFHARHGPLVDASMEIRLEATMGYLWFGELLHGLPDVTLETVLRHFDEAEWYAQAMLEGGTNPEGTFLPLEDPALRGEIEEVRELLAEFRRLSLVRFGDASPAALESRADVLQHALYRELSRAADEVETALQLAMARELKAFRTGQTVLIAASVLAALLTGLVFHRFERDRRAHFRHLRETTARAQESEARFRSLFEESTDAVFLHDTEGRILSVNRRAAEMLGRSPEELCTLNVTDLHPDDAREESQRAVREVAATGKVRFDSRFLRADGTLLDVDISASLVDPRKGLVQGLARDITEHKRTVETLQSTLRFLETLLDTIPNPVFYKDAAGVYQGCNKTFAEQILGLPRHAIVGKSLFDLPEAIPRDLADVYYRADQELFGRPGRQTYETQVQCADGVRRYFCFSKATYPDDRGRVAGIVGVMLDVTERRKSEAALRAAHDALESRVRERTAELTSANERLMAEAEERERAQQALADSEEKYSTLVESSLTGVFVYQGGVFSFTNQKFADIVGYSRDELAEMGPRSVVHPEDWPWVEEFARKRLAGGGVPTEYETRAVTKAGETVWLHLNNTVIEYRGRPATLGNVLDITRRKRAERALFESEEERRRLTARLLTAQEEERGRIARELHDGMGQSLSAMKFLVENLVSSMDPTAQGPQAEALRGLVPRLQAAVEEVRRISMALRPSILDDLGLATTVNWLCREFRAAHPEVEVFPEVSLPEAGVSEELKTVIYRVLQEAMNNAARHSRAKRVEVGLRETDGRIVLRVEDDGIGFDVEGARRGRQEERGCGLGNMKERTELSGGRFTLTSGPGQGTRVEASWALGPNP